MQKCKHDLSNYKKLLKDNANDIFQCNIPDCVLHEIASYLFGVSKKGNYMNIYCNALCFRHQFKKNKLYKEFIHKNDAVISYTLFEGRGDWRSEDETNNSVYEYVKIGSNKREIYDSCTHNLLYHKLKNKDEIFSYVSFYRLFFEKNKFPLEFDNFIKALRKNKVAYEVKISTHALKIKIKHKNETYIRNYRYNSPRRNHLRLEGETFFVNNTEVLHIYHMQNSKEYEIYDSNRKGIYIEVENDSQNIMLSSVFTDD